MYVVGQKSAVIQVAGSTQPQNRIDIVKVVHLFTLSSMKNECIRVIKPLNNPY
jgi:hypothetical protein